jgi:hypothetical protein
MAAISGIGPILPPQDPSKPLERRFHDELKGFISEFNPPPPKPANIANRVVSLNHLSKEAASASHDSLLQDAGKIVQTIVTQGLSIPGISKDISLLSAAEEFQKNSSSSELSKILDTFQKYPDATGVLLQEMDLLTHDLTL